jgi:hypothetical protein
MILLAGVMVAQTPEEYIIHGATIDAAKAMRRLYGNYNAKDGTSVASSDLTVTLYATQDAVIDGKRLWFLYTTSNTPHNDCHACTVHLGAAVFEQQPNRWVKIRDNSDIAQIGNWGAPLESKPVKWGTQAYGLVVCGGFTGQGTVVADQTLFAYEKGDFRQIFLVRVSDYAKPEWSFGPPAANGIFDVIVRLKPDVGREGLPAPGVYRYDGTEYKNTRTHEPLNFR